MGTKLNYAAITATFLAVLLYKPVQYMRIYNAAYLTPNQTTENWRTNTTFTPLEVPTTYYEPGKLSEAMNGDPWKTLRDNDPNGGFMLFRVKPGMEPHHIDFDRINGPVRVRNRKPGCKDQLGIGGVFSCGYCWEKTDLSNVQAEDILAGLKPDNYGCFTKMNDGIIDYLAGVYSDMPIDFHTTQHTAFISNLPERSLTAPLHSANLVWSIAMQFVGEKTWVFMDADHVEDDKFKSMASFMINLPAQAPKVEEYGYYHYIAVPGDVLVFPVNMAHAVATHPGPNIMINFRLKSLMSAFKQSPILGFAGLFNLAWFNGWWGKNRKASIEKIHNDIKDTVPGVVEPEVKLNDYVWEKHYAPNCGDSDPTNLDRIIARLLTPDAE